MLDSTLRWICWLFFVGFPTLTAYPVVPLIRTDSEHVQARSQWERYWIQYTVGILCLVATGFTLVGCLCCRRPRRPKGFQDKAEKCEQEFKDGNSIGPETTLEQHSVEGLELDVPRMLAIADRVQFEPLPVERIISGSKSTPKHKPLPLSASFYEERDQDSNTLGEPCREWFEAEELHVPREKLKYLREIGHGWFGKVVEGRAEIEGSKGTSKNGGVVVRILTEEATTKEKTWFLGEATPYLKLRHQNLLSLVGFCLETDPYLLLFESCLAGDLKGFLLSNRDQKSREALSKENIPTRIALDVASGLKHMHTHGFVHTDLSARNCLMAADLSAKLGDYGTAVEKYPDDYYVVGDRALPIRWSAPESVECTDTTIETREITSEANMWSYGVFLSEIATWGKRPYNEASDEQVIQMLLSLRTDLLPGDTRILQPCLDDCPPNVHQAIRLCMNLSPRKRPNLSDVRQVLLNERSEYLDFELRWENLRSHAASKSHARSASLQDLRGSIDSDYWTTIVEDAHRETPRSSFRLGPNEPTRNPPNIKSNGAVYQESGSETEEESWKGRIEKGVYTEKVKQKSKSVTDLMVLVHIELDSDAELSMTQVVEKPIKKKKKLNATGSDSDLRHNVRADEFDEALRKLRDPLPNNACSKFKLGESSERPKLLTLTMDQAQTPILRLSLDENGEPPVEARAASLTDTNLEISSRAEEHVLRLLSKGDPNLPLLRYDHAASFRLSREQKNEIDEIDETPEGNTCFSNDFSRGNNLEIDEKVDLVDVVLWNHALDSALEQKIPGFSDEAEFNESEFNETSTRTTREDEGSTPKRDTPHSRRDYSVYNADDEFSNGEELDAEQRRCLPNEDEEERKQLSTPDDEQSSDSGFRDKESCEEEENVCPPSILRSSTNGSGSGSGSTNEEEQLRILFELDTILDAEYSSALPASERPLEKSFEEEQRAVPEIQDLEIRDPEAPEVGALESIDEKEAGSLLEEEEKVESEASQPEDLEQDSSEVVDLEPRRDYDEEYEHGNENEDEDSSTMSLRSDNSYVSFGMEEEFVTAIRNELREKLPCAQMPVVEPLESHDDDNPSVSSDTDGKQWDDDDNEESSNQGNGGVGISIRYNVYGTPLSPIQEERESAVNSESLISNSRDASIASRESAPSEDVLLVDTRTNKMILLEGLGERLRDDDRDTTNGDISEEENLDYSCSMIRSCDEKSRIMITSGGAPMPSPEEEQKWQQSFPLQDADLMSTSFATERGWGSQDEDEEEEEEEEEDDEEEEDEENSSSSGEFVWKRYDEARVEQVEHESSLKLEDGTVGDAEEEGEEEGEGDEEEEDEDEDEEEEFTPSAWNATLAPHRSALRSPDKTLKSGDQKKSVWFKKQRYHCVYEYPKETLTTENQGEATTIWEPTSYADWEEIMDEPRLDLYPLDYDDANQTGNEEFFVSSSNRPFQFQTGESKYVSQFFPGAATASLNEERDEVDGIARPELRRNSIELINDYSQGQQHQLGELRHTRDRLKLNLSTNGAASSPCFGSTKQPQDEEIRETTTGKHESEYPENTDFVQDQCILPDLLDDNTLPKVPRKDIHQETSIDPATSNKSAQCDNQEKVEHVDKCSVLAYD